MGRAGEVFLELNTSLACDEVLDAVARWLASDVPPLVRALEPFGCCDAGGDDWFVRFESNVLMTAGIRVMARVLPGAYRVLVVRVSMRCTPSCLGGLPRAARSRRRFATGPNCIQASSRLVWRLFDSAEKVLVFRQRNGPVGTSCSRLWSRMEVNLALQRMPAPVTSGRHG